MNENTITILVVGVIAVASMALIPSKADTLALASVSGLVGFLTKAAMAELGKKGVGVEEKKVEGE